MIGKASVSTTGTFSGALGTCVTLQMHPVPADTAEEHGRVYRRTGSPDLGNEDKAKLTADGRTLGGLGAAETTG